jgi:hypothetical protein
MVISEVRGELATSPLAIAMKRFESSSEQRVSVFNRAFT